MSTYFNSTYASTARGEDEPHDWHLFTEQRLTWLYGPNHERERAAQTQTDLAAWRNLGRRPAA